MGADLGRETRLSGAALDHLQRAQARHRPILERISPPGLTAAEQGAAAVFADAGGGEVGVDAGLRCVMGGDDVNEAARQSAALRVKSSVSESPDSFYESL